MKALRLHIRSLLAACVAVVCAACAPTRVGIPLDSTQAAAAPAVSTGDTWTYRVYDAYTGIERGTERYRVERVSGSTITLAREGIGEQDVQTYDGGWNWLKRPATNLHAFDYEPAYPAFQFPMAPGKRWLARITATDPADGRRFATRVEGRVAGWERVKVPAGEFDALKIERIVYLDYWVQGLRGPSYIIETEWYAPQVKQSVRREAESRYLNVLGSTKSPFMRTGDDGHDDSGPRYIYEDWLVHELVGYSVR